MGGVLSPGVYLVPEVYLVPGGVLSPGGCLPRGVSAPGGLLLGGTWSGTPPVDRMTHASENITLPQTSFAGGNDIIIV